MTAVMSGLFLAALDQTIITTALGRIVEDFNSFSSLSWVVTAYLLTTTVTVPIAGKLSDMFGRRNLLMVGIALFTLSSFLSGISGSIEWLIAARALQGIGGGILTTTAFTIVGDLFSPRERGKWQGLIGSVFGLASVVGPLLGGYLTDPHLILGLTTDWRWTFYINIPIGIAAFALVSIFCPNFKHEIKHKIDWRGAGLLTAALASLIFATENTEMIFATLITNFSLNPLFIKLTLWLVAIVSAVLFVLNERRVASPILPLSLFRRPVFRLVMPIVLLGGAAFLGTILYLTQFLQQVLSASATTSGLMLIPMVFSLVIMSTVAGRIVSAVDRYKPMLIGGLAVTLVGIVSLTTLTIESSFGEIVWRMIIVGLGLGATFPLYNLAVQNEAKQSELGVVTSSTQLSRSLGSTIGTAVLGGILTTGVAASLGTISEQPFIQTLQQQPAVSQYLGKLDANTALQLNTPETKQEIEDSIRRSVEQSSLSASAKEQLVTRTLAQQDTFNTRVKVAFADSLRQVFFWAAGAVALSLVLALFLKEIPLRNSNEEIPDLI